MQFVKAKRTLARLRLALTGPSGSGKTYSALLIAAGLGGRVAVIDTERGSASLYAGLPGMPEYDVLNLDAPFSPERYIEAVQAAEHAGYDVLIIDSITHEWSGAGGCLEINDALSRSPRCRGNTWSAWAETTPRHRRFVDAILQSPLHVIATIRSKTDSTQEKDEKTGKTRVVKLGMRAETRDGMDYEFSVVLDLSPDGHWASASKDRTTLFSQPEIITPQTGARLRAWLDSATPPAPAPAPQAPSADFIESARQAAAAGTAAFIQWGNSMKAERPAELELFKSLPIFREIYTAAKAVDIARS